MKLEFRYEKEFRAWLLLHIGDGNFGMGIEALGLGGVPDIHAVINGVAFWMELKVGNTPWPIIRKEQRVWGLKYAAKGGKSFFIYCNNEWQTIYVYKNPVSKVARTGRYLYLQDQPVYQAELSTVGLRSVLGFCADTKQ